MVEIDLEDIENQKQAVDLIQKLIFKTKLKENTKKLFIKEFKNINKTIGIFGKYKTFFNIKDGRFKGKILIRNLAEKLAYKNFITITGENIYQNKNGRIIKSRIIHDHLTSEDVDEELYYRCLAFIPLYAISVITSKRSSSFHEEIEILENVQNYSIGLLFLNEVPRSCPFLKQIKFNKDIFYNCKNNDWKNCKKNKKNCPFTQQAKMDTINLQKFINKKNSILIISNIFKTLPDYIKSLIENKSKIFD